MRIVTLSGADEIQTLTKEYGQRLATIQTNEQKLQFLKAEMAKGGANYIAAHVLYIYFFRGGITLSQQGVNNWYQATVVNLKNTNQENYHPWPQYQDVDLLTAEKAANFLLFAQRITDAKSGGSSNSNFDRFVAWSISVLKATPGWGSYSSKKQSNLLKLEKLSNMPFVEAKEALTTAAQNTKGGVDFLTNLTNPGGQTTDPGTRDVEPGTDPSISPTKATIEKAALYTVVSAVVLYGLTQLVPALKSK